MATQTSVYNLWQMTANLPNWHHYYNANMDILEESFLKILSLGDVNTEELRDKSILRYNKIFRVWEVIYDREV